MNELYAEYARLRKELDDLRQRDNLILFDLGNPPELDEVRGEILDQMRKVMGELQVIMAVINERG